MKEQYRSPWFDLRGYKACTVKYEDGTRRTVLEHREVMEKHLGRILDPSEIVHHQDGNKRNNQVANLEVTNRSAHFKIHDHRETKYVDLNCTLCGVRFTKRSKEERARKKKGCSGPFCGKSCAGKWSRTQQLSRV